MPAARWPGGTEAGAHDRAYAYAGAAAERSGAALINTQPDLAEDRIRIPASSRDRSTVWATVPQTALIRALTCDDASSI